MRRSLLGLLAVAVALALGSAALAQETPQFNLGFAALAAQIPDVVGQPLENEHYGANGDSLQQTTTGLMVWRKADNWTAFTNGALTWVNGPEGLQVRSNDQRFDWEAPPPATPVATPTPAPTAALPTPTPPPTPTPAPPTPGPTPVAKANLAATPPNLVRGEGLEYGTLWAMGEVRNQGSIPAYNLTVTARVLTGSGSVAGTASQSFLYLGPGDSVGYRVDLKDAGPDSRVELSLDSSPSSFASYTRVSVDWVKNEKIDEGDDVVRYEFTGALNNRGSQPVSLSAVYVWFLDDQGRVVWTDQTYVPNTLAPGETSSFIARTTRTGANPQIRAISQVRYYAVGRLP